MFTLWSYKDIVFGGLCRISEAAGILCREFLDLLGMEARCGLKQILNVCCIIFRKSISNSAKAGVSIFGFLIFK